MTTTPSTTPEVGKQFPGALTKVFSFGHVTNQRFSCHRINRAIGIAACILVFGNSLAKTATPVERKIAGQEVNVFFPKSDLSAKGKVSVKRQIVPLNTPIAPQGHTITKPEGEQMACKANNRPEPRWWNRHESSFLFELYFYIVGPIFSLLLGYFIRSEF